MLEAKIIVETEVRVPLRPVATEIVELEPVAAVEVEVEVTLIWYMLRRFGPPQYSNGFPEHVMEHCVLTGVVPVTSAEPALMMFPQ